MFHISASAGILLAVVVLVLVFAALLFYGMLRVKALGQKESEAETQLATIQSEFSQELLRQQGHTKRTQRVRAITRPLQ